MNTPTRMAGYALGLAAVFAAALGAGKVVGGPEPVPPAAAHDGGGHGDSEAGGHESAAPQVPGGLQVAQDGYRLTPVSGGLPVGEAAPFRFRIIGPDGVPVTAYTPTH